MFGSKKRMSGEESASAIAQHIRKATRLQEKTDALEQILALTHPDGVFQPGYDPEALIAKIHEIAKLAIGR